MKKVVLITSAHGLIAPYTAKHLLPEYEIRHLTRNPKGANEYLWDLDKGYVDEKALENVSYIVHLAGQKFNHGRDLTEERKKVLWDTRIGASELLLEKLRAQNNRLEAFISASALGYYAFDDATQAIGEDGNVGDTFAAELSVGWEGAADAFKEAGMADRVVKLRVSFALGKEGSYFKELKQELPAFPAIPEEISQKTYFPWIHVEDMGGMFAYAVKNNSLDGVFNTPAPQVTSQEAIMQLMYYAKTDNLEAFDAVDIGYDGKYLSSQKIMEAGFTFMFPEIRPAILDLMQE